MSEVLLEDVRNLMAENERLRALIAEAAQLISECVGDTWGTPSYELFANMRDRLRAEGASK